MNQVSIKVQTSIVRDHAHTRRTLLTWAIALDFENQLTKSNEFLWYGWASQLPRGPFHGLFHSNLQSSGCSLGDRWLILLCINNWNHLLKKYCWIWLVPLPLVISLFPVPHFAFYLAGGYFRDLFENRSYQQWFALPLRLVRRVNSLLCSWLAKKKTWKICSAVSLLCHR